MFRSTTVTLFDFKETSRFVYQNMTTIRQTRVSLSKNRKRDTFRVARILQPSGNTLRTADD